MAFSMSVYLVAVLMTIASGFEINASTEKVIENITMTENPMNVNSSTRQGRGYSGDAYLDEAYNSCLTTKNAYSCFKYKALRYLHKVASPVLSNSPDSEGLQVFGTNIRLISIPDSMSASKDSVKSMFPDSQPRTSDSELDRLYKFALREAERFVRSHAFSVRIPTGASTGRDIESAQRPRIVDEENLEKELQEDKAAAEGRGKKKKLALLLPLLLFFKLKMLLVPILLSVLFIKKLLILAAILFPSLLSLVKFCKPHHGGHSYAGWSSGPDTSAEYSTGYGHVAPYHGDYHSRRSARWDAQSMAYRGHHRGNDDHNGA